MKTITIEKFPFKTPLGKGYFRAEVFLEDEDHENYRRGKNLKRLDYALRGAEIDRLSRAIALLFLEKNYRTILLKKRSLISEEIKAIQEVLGLKSYQFAMVLGLDKGSLSNILRGNREMQHSTQILVMERLGLELSRPGSMKALLEEEVTRIEVDTAAQAVFEKVRFAG